MIRIRTNYLNFDRGEDGELRLGIRRALQLKSGGALSVSPAQQLNPGTLMDVVNALSTKCAFNVCYNPRYFHACSRRVFSAVSERESVNCLV